MFQVVVIGGWVVVVDCWVGKYVAAALPSERRRVELGWVVVVLCGGLWCGVVPVVVGPGASGGTGLWPYRSSR